MFVPTRDGFRRDDRFLLRGDKEGIGSVVIERREEGKKKDEKDGRGETAHEHRFLKLSLLRL